MSQKLGQKHINKHHQKMSPRQIQFMNFVSFNQKELDTLIGELFETNPTFEVEDGYFKARSLHFDDVLDFYASETSIKDDLKLQLLERDDLEYRIMDYLIESIDDKGLIPTPDAHLAFELGVDIKTIQTYRTILKSFEPIGIGSETLQDYIITRLSFHFDDVTRMAIQIINDVFCDPKITKSVHYQRNRCASDLYEAVQARIHQAVSPPIKPMHHDVYEKPDIIVRVEDDTLLCELTRDTQCLTINYTYRDSTDHQIIQWYQESERFLQKLQFRNTLLMSVVSFIVGYQQDFFLFQKPLKGLKLSQIADALELNVSTVSRCLLGKTLVFNQEVYTLSDFLVSETKGGDSADVIKKRILKIIAYEINPYSDQKICEILKAEGMHVERRTVTKYRKALNIPSSHERRR